MKINKDENVIDAMAVGKSFSHVPFSERHAACVIGTVPILL